MIEEIAFESVHPRAVVVAPDGTERAIERVTPLAAPDAGGWLAVRLEVESMSQWGVYGFARGGEAEPRALSAALHLPRLGSEGRIDPAPVVESDGSFHYIADDGGELVLVHERADAIERIALGRAPDGEVRLLAGRSAWLVTSSIRTCSSSARGSRSTGAVARRARSPFRTRMQ